MPTQKDHFDEWFQRYYQEIYRYLSGLYPTLAEDLVQETFLTLYHQRDTMKEESLRAWLYRVAMNKGIDAVRSSKSRQQRHQAAQEEQSGTVLHNPEHSETRTSVRMLLKKMEPRQAQLLYLYSCGLSHQELAEVMEVQKSSISQLLLRAKKAFATQYQTTQHQ